MSAMGGLGPSQGGPIASEKLVLSLEGSAEGLVVPTRVGMKARTEGVVSRTYVS